jgi:hypothetical protein
MKMARPGACVALASRYDVAASGDTAPAEAMESLSSWGRASTP